MRFGTRNWRAGFAPEPARQRIDDGDDGVQGAPSRGQPVLEVETVDVFLG
jgi:hypothetical protein